MKTATQRNQATHKRHSLVYRPRPAEKPEIIGIAALAVLQHDIAARPPIGTAADIDDLVARPVTAQQRQIRAGGVATVLVQPLVGIEIAFLAEPLRAQRARMGTLAAVHEHVRVEVGLLREALVAIVAMESPVAVNGHVLFETDDGSAVSRAIDWLVWMLDAAVEF